LIFSKGSFTVTTSHVAFTIPGGDELFDLSWKAWQLSQALEIIFWNGGGGPAYSRQRRHCRFLSSPVTKKDYLTFTKR
jgi:hypothetical protein